MNGFIKKLSLAYFLFLLTMLSDNPGFDVNSSFMESKQNLEFVQTEVSEKPFQQKPVLPETEQLTENRNTVPKVLTEDSLAEPTDFEPDLMGVTPALIEIPAIGEHAEVIEVGLTEKGAMGTPDNIYQIGWFGLGTKPGNPGNAVMAGHVDGETSPGTFYNLKKLEPGDEIHVTGTNGKKLTFIVIGKEAYFPDEAPLEKIFGATSKPGLNLITCTGEFNRNTGDYEKRLVIYTELLQNT